MRTNWALGALPVLTMAAALFLALLLVPKARAAETGPRFGNDSFHIYILIGQSNMAGRGEIEEEDKAPLPRTYLLTGTNEWEVATAPINRYTNAESPRLESKLNPGYTFAQVVAAANPGIDIGLVSNARGGTTIDQWSKDYHGTVAGLDVDGKPWQEDAKNLYTRSLERMHQAQQYGQIKAVLWHQGEGNRGDTAYLEKLARLISDLRNDLGDPDLPFIAGEVYNGPGAYSSSPGFNQRLAGLPAKVPLTDVVSSVGTTVWDKTTHFDSASQRLLGYRYADKVMKLVYGAQIDTTPPSVPADISVVSKSATSATLRWEASQDDQAVTGYQVFVSGKGTPAAVSATPECTISDQKVGSILLINIVAFDAAGNVSEQSKPIAVALERVKLVP